MDDEGPLLALNNPSVGLAEKLCILSDIQRYPVELATHQFESIWHALTSVCLDATQPTGLRLAALQASTALLPVCTTQEMLSAYFSAFSTLAKTFFEANMDRLSNAFGDRSAIVVPDPQDILVYIGEQRKCVAFFVECTNAMAKMSLDHENLALDLLIDHFFAVVTPAIVRSSEVIPKLSPAGIEGPEAAKIGQEANALFTEALSILSPFITTYLKLFPPSPSPSQAVPCDDPKITHVLQQIVIISEKSGKNIKVQTAVWKLIRELILAHAYRIQNQTLVGKIIAMAISKCQSSWNTAISCAPRMVRNPERAELVGKGDEKAFENKVKASRFLWAVLGLLCRYYAPHCAPYFGKLASLVLLIGRNLTDDPNKPGALTRTASLDPLTPPAQYLTVFTAAARGMVTTMNKTACNCLRALLCSTTLGDEKKMKLLDMFAIRMGGEDPLSSPKLQILLYLFQNLPPSALFPQSIAALYWIVNGVEACCAEVLMQGLESVTVPASGFIYALSLKDPQALQDVECFLFQHLFHPHFLCSQLAAELHSFMLQNADEALQRRHVLLLANLVKAGGVNIVDSLAPLLPLLLNSMSAANKELLLREMADDVLGSGRQSDGSAIEEVVLYRLAAFLPAWTMQAYFAAGQAAASLALSVESVLGQIARSCLKLFTSHSLPTPLLISVARCLAVLMAYERLPDRDAAARTILEHLGDLLRNATDEPTKYNAPILLPYLIDLSILIPFFSPDMLPNFLMGYGQVMSTFSSTKSAVARLLARCNLKMRAEVQERVLRSCAGLYQQLLADGDWGVCAGAMQSFQHFVQFMPYPVENIQGLLSSECRSILVHYLSGKPIIMMRDQQPMSDAQLCDRIGSELASLTKEQLAQAQAFLVGNSSHQESVDKALALLAQASAILSTLPPSSLALAPQLQTQISQLAQFLPSASPSSSSSSSSSLSSSSSSSSLPVPQANGGHPHHPVIHLS